MTSHLREKNKNEENSKNGKESCYICPQAKKSMKAGNLIEFVIQKDCSRGAIVLKKKGGCVENCQDGVTVGSKTLVHFSNLFFVCAITPKTKIIAFLSHASSKPAHHSHVQWQ